MNLRLLHRRLAVLMGMAGLLAFAGGAGFEPVTTALAFMALVAGLFWHPDPVRSARMERIWLPLATLLVARALVHVFLIRGDVVIPVVDLLLLLMAAEALRALEAPNDLRLYALSFALILASTAYRPGILFLVGFVAYVGLATVALMVGHLRRGAERHGVRNVPLGRGLLTTTSLLSVVVLLVSGVVFLTFPRVSQGFSGRGDTMASSIAGFSDEVSLGQHGSTISGNPQIVLRVEFPGGAPGDIGQRHWRGRSYDRFDGVRWSRSRGLPPASAPRSWYRERWEGPMIEQRIFAAPLDSRVLFALHPAVDIDTENSIQPLVDNAGDFLYWGSGAPTYTALSPARAPSAERLRAAEDGFSPSQRHFLQLPQLDPAVTALADSLTAGLDTRYDRVKAVERWLQGFDYTRQLPATASETSLEHFLFERQAGHCEYFSTAMVVLLRAVGIEARNVNGFLGGQWSQFGNYLAVTQNQAHSWVEVWFPEYGWVTFDPTPAGQGTGSVTSSWFWPGRILFDGIQHRWGKWVLDYGADDQNGLLSQWSGFLTGEREGGSEQGSPGAATGGRSYLLAGAALVFALLLGWMWVRRSGPTVAPAARVYLALRKACAQAGLDVTPGLTPTGLLAMVRRARPDAARASERVIRSYLRWRWGGEPLEDVELGAMRDALKAARSDLGNDANSRPPRAGFPGVREASEGVSS
ncbi:MAG: transglutaminaseTgpA domain-containing protein [Gemmatimonadota bacterium]